MSGHSKWSTIKRQKGAADAKRGQLFTKLSNAITIAIKQGSGIADPESNFKLRLAVDRARAANVPKENIERAIERAKGGQAVDVEELMYEGFAPGGVAVMVSAVTDNKQRTVSSIKNVLEKSGGTLANPGAVSYLFSRLGEIIAKKDGLTSDEMLNRGITAGVTDMEEEGNSVFYYTDPQMLQDAKKEFEKQGVPIESTQISFVPLTYIKQDEQTTQKVLDLVEKLEDLEDVQEVYTNLG